jgi:biopolymer transport protein ExbD
MQISDTQEKRELENLLPLVNVVFLLLIFFMVAGAFSSPELFTINPAVASNESRADQQSLTIVVNQQGELAINQNRVKAEELTDLINRYLEGNPNSKVQLKPDAEAEALRIVELLEILANSNLQAIHIMTSASE